MTSSSSLIMMPMSTAFSAIARARLAAYRHGLFHTFRLPAPVISVGNLTTGGTGKTPMVEWVCRAIARLSTQAGPSEEKRLCVLTTGYGRVNPGSQVLVSDAKEVLANARESGDEPFLLAHNLLGVAAVLSNPDRVAAGNWASENLNSNVFVLDDGFQYLRLARNLDLVVIDATNPWGGGQLLPSGRLREPQQGLSRADCIVITRADQVEELASLRNNIQRVASDVPILHSRMLTAGLRTLDGQAVNQNHKSQPVGAFCAIGNPKSFFNHLRREGYTLSFTRTFIDHHRYKQTDIDTLAKEAKACGVETLLTTAKDATKLSSLEFAVPCYVLEIEISIDDADQLVKLIQNAIT